MTASSPSLFSHTSSSQFSSDAASDTPFPKSNIYTRQGDKGKTYLYNMERVSKTEVFFDALGDTDELGSQLAVAKEWCAASGNGLEPHLIEIQSRLMDIGSQIATPLTRSTPEQLARVAFPHDAVAELELVVNEMDAILPPLTNFILSGGGHAASSLHVCRSVCRRAERRTVALVQAGECPPEAGRYLNRVSDFLYVAARYAAQHEKQEEVVYQKAS
jgi:cob(I)alamin adenosyltransferase